MQDDKAVTGRKLCFTGKTILRGSLIRTHFEIQPEAESQLSVDIPRSVCTSATVDIRCIGDQTEQG